MPTIGENTQGQACPDNQTEIWLCLRFTHLSLNSAGVPVDAPQATAVTDQQHIWQMTNSSAEYVVASGMTVNHALMLCPDIILHTRDLQKEALKLLELSHWAYRFTSLVSQYNDHTLLLEIGKSKSLFKGIKHLIHLIKNDLSNFSITTKLGLANTPKAAYISSFSQASESQKATTEIANISINHLDIEEKLINKLHYCGFRTLADLNSIPRTDLGARFGADFLHYLSQLNGELADPQTGITPPETFQVCADFSEPIRNVAWIQQQLDRLLSDLMQFITLRQLICRTFTWRFYHENNQLLKTVSIGLSATQNTLSTLKELTDLKLASLHLNWEFSSIELSSTELVPIQLFNDDLFNPSPHQEQFNQLADKLITRLGYNALFRVNQENEHLPELINGRRSTQRELVKELSAHYSLSGNTSSGVETTHSEAFKNEPLWLLEHPKRLAQRAKQPLLDGPLNIINGPNRITSHWWAKLQSRDYFIARQRNGRLLWLFFDRGSRQWYMHGLFA